ncbi:hypothetical protein TWF696_000822 [Orbilia brochopaga]|uniref:Translocon-associated protein subunit alpha n=1 Tax=Orbilia brochopaga TaxID=3140254 RepID=A0AAV9VCW3_9PEZI
MGLCWLANYVMPAFLATFALLSTCPQNPHTRTGVIVTPSTSTLILTTITTTAVGSATRLPIMRFSTALPLLALSFLGPVLADLADSDLPPPPPQQPEVAEIRAKVDVTFPDNDSPLGITIVNGRVARVNLEVKNHESHPITVEAVGGQLRKHDRSTILRNLTASKVATEIPASGVANVPYSFVPNMHAQDVVFELGVVFSVKEGGRVAQYTAYNGTISVAEPPTSLLDPQILFLYLFILGVVSGGGYLAYQTWVVPMLPKPKRVRPTPVAPAEAKTSSAEVSKGGFDESWIPEHHLKRPVAQKVRSGSTPKPKGAKKE